MQEQRIVEQLDRMVAAGRVTLEEAERLRATQGTPEFEAALGAIRARHASGSLDAAVQSGRMTREEADANLAELRSGNHPKGLRARLRGHKPPRPVAE